jgi:hypothetical protein
VDGNLKLILGLIWTLILRFTIQEIRYIEITAMLTEVRKE